MSHMQPEFCYTFRDFDGVFKIGEVVSPIVAQRAPYLKVGALRRFSGNYSAPI